MTICNVKIIDRFKIFKTVSISFLYF